MASLWRRRRFMWEAASLVPEAVLINILSSRPWFFLATLFFPLILLYLPSFFTSPFLNISSHIVWTDTRASFLRSSALILPICPQDPDPSHPTASYSIPILTSVPLPILSASHSQMRPVHLISNVRNG